jgi:ParB family chromosome partitioning protein
MTKKLAEKSKLINLPPSNAAPSGGATAPAPGLGGGVLPKRPYTGVGEMMGVLGKSSPLGRELEEVKARLKTYEGAIPVRLLDPRRVRRSRLANRHDSEFSSQEFARLKEEIAAAGVNVQPIKVRPVEGDAGADYEVVFGHRRHQACLDLGIQVLAMIEQVEDRDLWLQMDRENRERLNLSPWEQGKSIQRALQAGLFPSVRKLAEEAGIDHSNASKALKLAELPPAVVEAFSSPNDIQLHWAKPIGEALQKDPESVMARARAIAARGTVPRPPKQVLDELLGLAPAAAAQVRQIKDGDRVVARITPKRNGRVQVDIHRPVDLDALEAALKALFQA